MIESQSLQTAYSIIANVQCVVFLHLAAPVIEPLETLARLRPNFASISSHVAECQLRGFSRHLFIWHPGYGFVDCLVVLLPLLPFFFSLPSLQRTILETGRGLEI